MQWPEELPQSFLIDGLRYSAGDNVLRTEMSAGEDKTRKRYSKTVDNISGRIFIEGQSEYETLMDFYDSNSASRWDWKHPFTGEVKQFRFLAPPEPRPVSHNQWLVDVNVEVLV